MHATDTPKVSSRKRKSCCEQHGEQHGKQHGEQHGKQHGEQQEEDSDFSHTRLGRKLLAHCLRDDPELQEAFLADCSIPFSFILDIAKNRESLSSKRLELESAERIVTLNRLAQAERATVHDAVVLRRETTKLAAAATKDELDRLMKRRALGADRLLRRRIAACVEEGKQADRRLEERRVALEEKRVVLEERRVALEERHMVLEERLRQGQWEGQGPGEEGGEVDAGAV